MREPEARHAFTLLETVVIVCIIALLASILLPALAAARGQGRLVQCASNVRQIGTALIGYALDSADTFPMNVEPWNVSLPALRGRAILAGRPRVWVARIQEWMNVCEPPWLRALACPQANAARSVHAPPPDEPGASWVLNTYCSGRRATSIPRPGDGVLLLESGEWSQLSEDTGYLEQSTYPRFYPHPRAADSAPGVPWKWAYQNRKRNICWCDGHVDAAVARRWPAGDEQDDSDRIRHMRFGLPGTHPWDP
jgi:prepilin-type processing-associated H-X9-DG protein